MSFSAPTSRQAVFELLFASALWGFGFVATQWALTTWNPQGVLVWRLAGAVVLGEVLHLFFKPRKKLAPWTHDFKLSIPAGLLLGCFLLLQTIGLQYTSASKSGFITTLYVIFVPAVNFFFLKKKFPVKALFMAALACFGTFLLMDLRPATLTEQINRGDLWTLASAVLAAFHIIYIGRITRKIANPFRLNNFQSLWALIAILPVVVFGSPIQHGALNANSMTGLVVLSAACSVLGFFIQVRAQKVLTDTTASMLFLLESPYAFFFAYLLMGDRLNYLQGVGAVLIFGAALGTVLVERSAPTTRTRSESPPLQPIP
jgi:drug/metabolite transporter (DMT)-like permease